MWVLEASWKLSNMLVHPMVGNQQAMAMDTPMDKYVLYE